MPRRRNENGLKRQQRIVSEQRRREAAAGGNLENPQIEQEHAEPVPPGVTQSFENLAPPITAPRPED